MIQALLPFLTAIALSTIAAFYSVIGLAQIFPGSFWPIVIMGTVLEVAKLVTVSWLYNNWNVTMRAMRYYFVIAIVFLMLITSMGIFGFLSRAHIESNIVVGGNSVQIQIIEQQEKISKERLAYLLKKAGDDPDRIARTTDRAIQETQAELKRLSEEKLPLLKEENKLLAEVGPIKYIAEALYGKEDPDFIDKAVRVVILIIIVVFDPLAILLLIAANQSYRRIKEEEKPEEEEPRKKANRKRKVDNQPVVSVESFVDNKHQLIPKDKITNLDGGSF
jgi:hypothetical protein